MQAAPCRGEGQDDRFAETAEREVAGVEGTEFRFKGQEDIAGVFEAAEESSQAVSSSMPVYSGAA